MEKKEYLNEERYQKNNAKVKNIGKVLLIVGIILLVISSILIVVGFMGFGSTAVSGFDIFNNFGNGNEMNAMKSTAGSAFGSMGLFALGGFIGTTGFTLTAAGAIVIFIAHRREITAYTTQQVMPVAQEGIEKMTPTVANSVGTIASSVAKGIKSGINEANQESTNNDNSSNSQQPINDDNNNQQ